MTSNFEHEIENARKSLCSARHLLGDEIANYPTPIAGCDAQFNHLLAERHKVLEALRTLDSRFFVPTPRTPTENAGIESR